jgi:hypothetical protein
MADAAPESSRVFFLLSLFFFFLTSLLLPRTFVREILAAEV